MEAEGNDEMNSTSTLLEALCAVIFGVVKVWTHGKLSLPMAYYNSVCCCCWLLPANRVCWLGHTDVTISVFGIVLVISGRVALCSMALITISPKE